MFVDFQVFKDAVVEETKFVVAADRLGVVYDAAVGLSRWEIHISISTPNYVKAKELVENFDSESTQVEPVIERQDISKQENPNFGVFCQFSHVFKFNTFHCGDWGECDKHVDLLAEVLRA